MANLLLGIRIGAEGGPQTVREVRRIDDQVKRLQERNKQAAETAKALGEAYQLSDDEIAAVTDQLLKQQKAADSAADAFERLTSTEQAIRQLQDALEPDANANRLLQSLGDIVESSQDVDQISRRLSDAFDLDDAQVDELARSLELLGQEGQDTERIARQLSDAFDLPDAEADALVRQLRQLEDAAKGADINSGGLTGRITELGIAIKSAGVDLLVDALRSLGGAVVGTIGRAINEFQSFDSALVEFSAKSGVARDDLDSLGEAAKELAAVTSQTPAGVAETATALLTLGVAAEDVESSLGGVVRLADVLGEDPVITGRVLQTGVNVFGEFGETTDSIADKLNTLINTTAAGSVGGIEEFFQLFQQAGSFATAAGVGFDELATAFATLRDSGASAEVAATGLRTVLASISSPAGPAAEALSDLGVNAFDAQGNFIGLEDTLRQFQAATAELSQQEQLDLLTTIFGREGAPAILTLLSEVDGAYQSTFANIQSANNSVSESLDVINQSVARQAELFQGQLAAALTDLGEALSPIVSLLIGLGQNVLTEFTTAFDGFTTFTEAAERLNAVLVENPEIAASVGQALAGIAESLTNLLTNQLVALTEYLAENPDAIQQNVAAFGQFAASVVDIVNAIGTVVSILQTAKDVFDITAGAGLSLVTSLVDGFRLLADTVGPLLDSLQSRFQGLINTANQLINTASNLPGVGGLIPQPRFTGGPLSKGGLYSVAEKGPELARIGGQEVLINRPSLITPQASGYVYNASQTARKLSYRNSGSEVDSLRREIRALHETVRSRSPVQSRDTYVLNTQTPTQDAGKIAAGKLRNMARMKGM